jgi:aminoglycoside phosphotransferase (APT) family kinase protein
MAAGATVEGIDQERVTAWATERIDGLKPPLAFELIAGGHSNLTYKFTDSAGAAYVLRRPPLGHVLESAHDMGREHRIISALIDTDVPVPRTHGLCEDPEVNGAPFYLMKFVEGVAPHEPEMAATIPESERGSAGEHIVDVLATLHLIDPDDVGLGTLARKEGYVARQLKRWTQQWEATKTHEIPDMEESCRLLHENVPEQIGSAIVHGDYRIGNMLIHGGRMAALLDWELCTLGDPLADVGYLLNNWVLPGERGAEGSPTGVGGFPSREHICEVYEERTGRDLARINYYRAFSHWRLGAIAQGVYKRYLVGAMGKNRDFDLEKYKQSIHQRAEDAVHLLTS